jgi:lysophospholipase L1-like esterase
VEKEVRSLTENDVVVFCGGANDIGRALHQITNFITDNKHTNIILISAPHRYDLTLTSCVNKEITPFNRKLRKMTKMHHHASILEMPNVRNLFTNHRLHLNGQGKEKLSNQIVSHIYSILDQNLGSPIIPKWEKEQRSGNANIVSNELELTKDPGNKE